MKDSRAYILQTAYHLFLKKSYKAVTIRELMEQTNFTKGAFYHHFQSKEQIFKEILDTYFKNLTRINYTLFSTATLAEFIEDHLSYNAKTRLALNKLSNGEDSDANYFSFLFEALRIFPDFQQAVLNDMELEFSAWVAVIANALQTVEIISRLSAEQLAHLFINLSDGIAIRMIIKNNSSCIDEFVGENWRNLYSSLKK